MSNQSINTDLRQITDKVRFGSFSCLAWGLASALALLSTTAQAAPPQSSAQPAQPPAQAQPPAPVQPPTHVQPQAPAQPPAPVQRAAPAQPHAYTQPHAQTPPTSQTPTTTSEQQPLPLVPSSNPPSAATPPPVATQTPEMSHSVAGVLPSHRGPDPRLQQITPVQPVQPPATAAATPAVQPTPVAVAPQPALGPPATPPPPTASSDTSSVVKEVAPKKKKIEHRGFVTSADVGVLGCSKAICASSKSHGAQPGLHVGGFLGSNLGGIFELGLAAGWGKLQPHVLHGSNMLGLYGINASDAALPAAALGFDVNRLAVQSVSMTAMQAGPRLRLHVVPRGRLGVYAGAGFAYSLFRNDYTTTGGPVRLDFHGFTVPIHGGFDVYVVNHLSLGLRYDYMWTYHAAMVATHPQQTAALPLSVLDSVLVEGGAAPTSVSLPHFWTATANIKLTL